MECSCDHQYIQETSVQGDNYDADSQSNLVTCALIFPFAIITGIAGEFIYGASDRVRCQI